MSYGLSLKDGIKDGVIAVSVEARLRFVALTFPSALPYVCEMPYGKTYHDSIKDLLRDVGGGREEWVHGEGARDGRVFQSWKSWDGTLEVTYGLEDWPEPRVVLVGELNPYQDRRAFDLYDEPERSAGGRLRRLVLGVHRETYFRRFARHNLCVGKWSAPAARARATELSREYPTQVFVLLGRKVQEAFGVSGAERYSCVSGWNVMTLPLASDATEPRAVLLPHPSGRCREWNDPSAFERARRVLLEACPGLPLGEC